MTGDVVFIASDMCPACALGAAVSLSLGMKSASIKWCAPSDATERIDMRTQTNRGAPKTRTGTKAACSGKAHPGPDRSPHKSGRWKGWLKQAMTLSSSADARSTRGSLDGDGAADHDQPYRFGFRPRTSAPYPFNTRQYARLLVLRGRVQDQIGASLELDPVAKRQCGLRPAA